MYEFIVSYPLDDFPALDGSIQELARQFGGQDVGSGAGIGQRDLVFWFSDIDPATTAFIAACFTLPEIELTITQVK